MEIELNDRRRGAVTRRTSETEIEVSLTIDGDGSSSVATGVGAFDHFLTLFARHGLFDLSVAGRGDLHIDAHHLVEDVAICLGQSLAQALGDHRGLRRTAHAVVPMDEALATVAIDLGGRAACVFTGQFTGPRVGDFDTELVEHFFNTLAHEARLNAHLLLHYGRNTHHEVEAIFKAFARALDAATQRDPRLRDRLPSTKEHIEGAL